MRYYLIFALICSSSCSLLASRPSNEIDALAEEVIKKKEGIQITLEPIDETKHKWVFMKHKKEEKHKEHKKEAHHKEEKHKKEMPMKGKMKGCK